MWRILLLVSCFVLPSLGQDDNREEGQFIEQSEITIPLPALLTEEEAIPSDAAEYPSREVPSVSFPLERPNTDNIDSVCQYLGRRKTYPPGSLPTTGFGHLQRQADALQRMEESFASCCRGLNLEERMECALGGWRESLDQFCKEEYSIKTRVHDCCREREEDKRHECFALAAPSLSYQPLPEGTALPDQDDNREEGQFIEQSEITIPLPALLTEEEAIPSDAAEYPSREVPSVSFPLERPDTDNIDSVCQYLGRRKTYPPGSLPTTGFGHLQRQADALQRMEESFASCCRGLNLEERMECALGGWKESLDQFCKEEYSIKTRVHDCCRKREEDERHECFALAAPSLSYQPPVDTLHGKSSTCLPEGTASPDQENSHCQ
ncbi:extracellular matrix protein 1-like [Mobula hypostoma]|uniref:extracellular matrix protein 1-like n=1 Tax=Mobula hypostoma TaxID=723540 RepID=UPI002FC3880E